MSPCLKSLLTVLGLTYEKLSPRQPGGQRQGSVERLDRPLRRAVSAWCRRRRDRSELRRRLAGSSLVKSSRTPRPFTPQTTGSPAPVKLRRFADYASSSARAGQATRSCICRRRSSGFQANGAVTDFSMRRLLRKRRTTASADGAWAESIRAASSPRTVMDLAASSDDNHGLDFLIPCHPAGTPRD